MNKDIECPYCEQEFDVCQDDGHGCEDGTLYEQECPFCEKIFILIPSISYHFYGHKADCLNGSPHNFKPVGVKYWKDWFRCKDCGYEKRGEFDQEYYDQFMGTKK